MTRYQTPFVPMRLDNSAKRTPQYEEFCERTVAAMRAYGIAKLSFSIDPGSNRYDVDTSMEPDPIFETIRASEKSFVEVYEAKKADAYKRDLKAQEGEREGAP